MTALNLFQIAQEYRAITDVLMDSGCDEQALKDTLEGEAWPLELKAQNYGFVIRNLQASAAAIKEAEAQMASRRKSIENRASYMLERLKTGMDIAGVSKIECPHFAITIRNNPPSVDVFEPGLIPAEYMKTPEPPPPVVDKTAIKEAIKAGREVPGAMLAQDKRIDIK
ncbi:MAG TPA: siphovirus Gp157 family protein [Noviherbaspirillum sp.]|nr:siphovirus Gp157 family protein [Noviherbaspirillum sp.]